MKESPLPCVVWGGGGGRVFQAPFRFLRIFFLSFFLEDRLSAASLRVSPTSSLGTRRIREKRFAEDRSRRDEIRGSFPATSLRDRYSLSGKFQPNSKLLRRRRKRYVQRARYRSGRQRTRRGPLAILGLKPAPSQAFLRSETCSEHHLNISLIGIGCGSGKGARGHETYAAPYAEFGTSLARLETSVIFVLGASRTTYARARARAPPPT